MSKKPEEVSNVDPNTLPSKNGKTLLHKAAKENNIPALKMLLNQNKISVNTSDNDQNSVLHFAAQHADGTAVGLLLEHQALSGIGNAAGNLAIHIAAKHNAVGSLQHLANEASMKARNNVQETPAHLLTKQNPLDRFDALEILVNNQANLTTQDGYGNTPIQYLLQDTGLEDAEKQTRLLAILEKTSITILSNEILRSLLNNPVLEAIGFDLFNWVLARSILENAPRSVHRDNVIELAIRQNLPVEHFKTMVIKSIKEAPRLLQTPVDNKTKPPVQTGNSALTLAMYWDRPEHVAVLVEHDVDIMAQFMPLTSVLSKKVSLSSLSSASSTREATNRSAIVEAGDTVVHYAIRRHNKQDITLPLFQQAIEKNPDVLGVHNAKGNNPAMLCVMTLAHDFARAIKAEDKITGYTQYETRTPTKKGFFASAPKPEIVPINTSSLLMKGMKTGFTSEAEIEAFFKHDEYEFNPLQQAFLKERDELRPLEKALNEAENSYKKIPVGLRGTTNRSQLPENMQQTINQYEHLKEAVEQLKSDIENLRAESRTLEL